MANKISELTVAYHEKTVGFLRYLNDRTFFAYDESWLRYGFSISPRSLPLENRVFEANPAKFNGLFGVFADSLPDGWGTLLAIKYFRKKRISYLGLNPLEKLSLVNKNGLGGLTYSPFQGIDAKKNISMTMDDFFEESIDLIDNENSDFLDEIFSAESSTGGARPKAHVLLENDEWIVKFRERNDPKWIGRMEYEYNLAARESGICVPEVRLLPSNNSDGYFASKRFDRIGGNRIHMLSLSGLLEVPKEMPLLDYVSFLQATGYITHSQLEVEKAFRLACFNVFSKNYDDHSKNFAFLYDENKKSYVLAPAYDLTRTINQKEHEMSCNGVGLPTEKDLIEVAIKVGIPVEKAKKIISFVKNVVESRLGEWLRK